MLYFEPINTVFMALEFSVIIGAIFYFGRKAQALERIEKDIKELKHNVRILTNHQIKNDSTFDSTLLM